MDTLIKYKAGKDFDFNIEIPDEDAENILSMQQAVDYINNKI